MAPRRRSSWRRGRATHHFSGHRTRTTNPRGYQTTTSYQTFDNIDFGTVKGFSLTYDMRRTGNLWMRASYTLQFADGTGSDPNTSLRLINSGQPNLRTIAPLNFDQRHAFQITADFRYGRGKDYNGPMLFGSPMRS